jgi:hypothetical protein
MVEEVHRQVAGRGAAVRVQDARHGMRSSAGLVETADDPASQNAKKCLAPVIAISSPVR